MEKIENLKTDARALESARGAWLSLASERKRRARLKGFTYGRQWEDPCMSSDGRRISERQRMSEEGRLPVTNNIIRQMVKSIIGRYRYMCQEGAAAQDAPGQEAGVAHGYSLPTAATLTAAEGGVGETDARALEEFLISGMVIQRLGDDKVLVNVSPEMFFHQPFQRSDASDCRMMGMLHDMGMARLMGRFAHSDPYRARAISRALGRAHGAEGLWGGMVGGADFSTPRIPGTYRVVELWRLRGYEMLKVTDTALDRTFVESIDALPRLEGLNRARADIGTGPLTWSHYVCERWECVWLTATGEVLESELMPPGSKPPFELRFYPYIDGEVHSLVEDVVEQQKYVNRLISLLDHIISSSAKGVLLYPADQLPEGFTWRDIRRIWSNPNGILPFRRTAKGMVPQQVCASGSAGAGAAEMLKMQLQLFEQISGAAGALSGKSSSAQGEGMLRTELENAMVSMLDILATFRGFVLNRDKRLEEMY